MYILKNLTCVHPPSGVFSPHNILHCAWWKWPGSGSTVSFLLSSVIKYNNVNIKQQYTIHTSVHTRSYEISHNTVKIKKLIFLTQKYYFFEISRKLAPPFCFFKKTKVVMNCARLCCKQILKKWKLRPKFW